ncbi:MAG: MMPL family transporter, partial [bacterium]
AARRKTAPTGFPVTFYAHTRMIKEGLVGAAFLAALAIMLLLLLDFTEEKYAVLALVPLAILAVWSYQMSGWTAPPGFILVMVGGMSMFDMKAVGYMLLALIPLAMGAAWMLGMMSLFGIDYNLANVVAIPLLMGIGVVYCVHIIHRFRQEGEDNVYDVVRHTGGAVFLAAMTTMIGFGALTAGSHGGMKSMGKTMLIGIFTCMVTALVVLPAMLRLLPGVRKAEAELAKSGEHPFRAPKKQMKENAKKNVKEDVKEDEPGSIGGGEVE